MRVARCERGFTLVEILIAVTVLAVTMASLYRVFGGTLRTVSTAEGYAYASILAEETMNGILYGDEPLAPREMKGKYEKNGDYSWEADITEFDLKEAGLGERYTYITQAGEIKTYRVRVAVGWKDGSSERGMELVTLKTLLEAGN